jgi:hypothetical protein
MGNTLFLLSALLLSMTAHSAILIESVDDEGKHGRVLIDEGRARIDAGTLGGYMLINLDDGSAYAINHSERAILDLHSPLVSTHPHDTSNTQKTKPPTVTFQKLGKGPVIAGYQTIRYKVSIDGLHCFDEFLSEQLLTYPDVKRFVEVIGESTGADSETGMGAPYDAEAPCESADELADDYYYKLGIPMRTVGSNGLTSHEIKRVDAEVDPPAGTFTSPPDYKKVTRSELIERAGGNLSGHSDISNLSAGDIEKMQQQIKKQMEIMKKRPLKSITPEERKNIDAYPINK